MTSAVVVPTPTKPASFIYPLNCTPSTSVLENTQYISVPVPSALMEYLQEVVVGPAPLTDIVDCSALPKYFTNGPLAPKTSNVCYTTYSTITYGSKSTVLPGSTYHAAGMDDTTSPAAASPSQQTLSAVSCYQVQLRASSDASTISPGTITETPGYLLSPRSGSARPVSDSAESVTTRSSSRGSTTRKTTSTSSTALSLTNSTTSHTSTS